MDLNSISLYKRLIYVARYLDLLIIILQSKSRNHCNKNTKQNNKKMNINNYFI